MKQILTMLCGCVAITATAGTYDIPRQETQKLESVSILKTEDAENSSYPSHRGRSPKAFDKIRIPSDTFIVSDRGADNDSYRFRSDSGDFDFTFELKINRYVGDKNKLLANKLLTQKFKLHIPAFDVDQSGSIRDCDGDEIDDTLLKEVDEVYFNGEKIGILSGGNDLWDNANNVFELDISKLNLPSEPGQVTTNTVQIKIDTLNKDVVLSSGQVGCKQWATEIDYVAIEFDTVDPVLMLVGLGGGAGSFEDSEYKKQFDELGIPSEILEHSTADFFGCMFSPATSYKKHGLEFKEHMKTMSDKYKANKFNLLAHSKGGLDARYLINHLEMNKEPVATALMDGLQVQNPLEVHSLVAHGTPYYGTLAADAIVLSYFPELFEMGGAAGFVVADLCDLTTDIAREFSETTPITDDVNFLAIKAKADINGDATLDTAEVELNQVGLGLSNKLYDLLRNASGFDVEVTSYPIGTPVAGLYDMYTITPIDSPLPNFNDTMVTIQSAAPSDVDKSIEVFGNHKTVIMPQQAGKPWTGVQHLVIDEALNGMLKWSVE